MTHNYNLSVGGLTTPFFSFECSTVLKGTAIVFVIFGHRGLIDCAGSWGVLIFLVLSGYGIFKSTQQKGLDGFWHNRVIGVFVPYVLFSVFQLGLSIVKGEAFGVENVFCTVTGLDFGFNLDPTMWYISYIFACYAIFYVAWHFYWQRGAVSFVVVLLAFFVLMAIVGLTNSVWHRGPCFMGLLLGFSRRSIARNARGTTCSERRLVCDFPLCWPVRARRGNALVRHAARVA